MEAVKNMAPLSDITSQMEDDCAWPLEIKIEPEVTIFGNDGLDDGFNDVSDLPLHHICSICDFTTISLSDLSRHIRQQHYKKKPVTKKEYKYTPRKPIPRVTPNVQLLQCNDCEFKTRWKSRLANHVVVHAVVKQYSCDYCPYRSSYIGHFKQHVERHSAIRRHTCGLCGYSTQSSSDLKKHSRIHYDVKPFVCSVCNYGTTSSSYLKIHMSKHTGDRPFKCDHCEYSTARRGDLTSHMLSHSTEKPFMCPCGFKTARAAHLKRHMATHNSNCLYDCKECNKSFNSTDALKRHMLVHVKERKHACSYCDYRAHALSTVNRHIKRMHTEARRPSLDRLQCLYCNYKCKTELSFQRHTKSRHFSIIFNNQESSELHNNNPLCSEDKTEFICFHCGFSTTNFQMLQEHIPSQHFRRKDKPG